MDGILGDTANEKTLATSESDERRMMVLDVEDELPGSSSYGLIPSEPGILAKYPNRLKDALFEIPSLLNKHFMPPQQLLSVRQICEQQPVVQLTGEASQFIVHAKENPV